MSEIFQIVNNTCAGSLCVLVPAGTSLAVIGTGSSAAGANFITGFEEQTYRIKLDRSHKTVSKWITIRHCNMKHLTAISSLEENFHTAPKATVWHMTSYPCKSRNLLCWGSTDLLCMEQGLWNTHLHLQHIRQRAIKQAGNHTAPSADHSLCALPQSENTKKCECLQIRSQGQNWMLMVEVRGEWFDKIKTLAGHNKYYLCGYQLSLLSQAFWFRLCVYICYTVFPKR